MGRAKFYVAPGREGGMSATEQASAQALVTTVSLENVLLDVKELGRGMELIRRECSIHDNSVLRNFLSTSEGGLDKLQRDARTAEVAKGAGSRGRPGPRRCVPLHGLCSGSWARGL